MSGAKFVVRHQPADRNVRYICAANRAYIRLSPYLAGALVAFFFFVVWKAVYAFFGAIGFALGAQ